MHLPLGRIAFEEASIFVNVFLSERSTRKRLADNRYARRQFLFMKH
jgi:hypothetical protein